ncbi:hypothetical protein J1777_07205 [Comamonas denitrificans]|jgi:hypothetical protein|uniref:Uncharacterized protein n=1 Tax=Comamonas denitrificans TaxID=117506 RepID=A0A939KEQ6_9BURK|nr:hypothetical protein [Comamonas denitrificans]MBP7840716.1 hypothetical protein [Comamonas sp.]MCZ2107579.1 hypothetical protein [Burkholderiales bacterium]MBO1249618.1 hypothetical protein [Comamonas denitrificans]HRF21835.1 hypothetical protein [Comamonas denitrificans]HRL91793.1 hypothetical protein [Comamonas denitrificans]
MDALLRIPLETTPAQVQRLLQLQQGFAQLCNALAPLVQQTRVWNRVALHHLAYRQLREAFPQMGSQMVCNAIYSVSRTCRLVFQSPSSPLHLDKLGDRPLPLLRFGANSPVYFDRHTLSIKAGQLSMFTLDGRMRFELALAPEVQQRFAQQKLREVVLQQGQASASGVPSFALVFLLVDHQQEQDGASALPLPQPGELPEYVMVDEVV